jgi:energy-converting hydrogenase B subunit D
MYWELEITLYAFLIFSAFIALYVKDLLTAVVSLSVFSFVLALLFVLMGAVDVGFMEAAVGAGVTGVLFIIAIYRTSRRSKD